MTFRRLGAPALITALTLLAGCSRDKPEVVVADTANFSKVREAYARATSRLKRPPQNMEELTPDLQALGDPTALLQSRTGEPIEIIWGVDARAISKSTNLPKIIAYEKTATKGKHFIVNSMGIVPVTDAELAEHLK